MDVHFLAFLRHGAGAFPHARATRYACAATLHIELASDQRMVRIGAELFLHRGAGASGGFSTGCCAVALRY